MSQYLILDIKYGESVRTSGCRRISGGVEKEKFHTEFRTGPACKF